MLEREMWEAYAKQACGVTFDGKPLLTWDELGEESQICWKAAASVCADEIERLRKEVDELKDLMQATVNYTGASVISTNYTFHAALEENE